jgi:ribose transport system permease protein
VTITELAPDPVPPASRPASQPDARRVHPARRPRPLPFVERYGLLLLTDAVCVYFSLVGASSDTFATQANIQTILSEKSVLAILALATMIPLVAGQLDLSLGANLGISSIATATAMSRFGIHPLAAALIGIAVGAGIGLVNGVVVGKLGVNALVATLGASTVISGIVTWYTAGSPISSNISAALVDAGGGTVWGFPRALFWLLPVAALVWYLLAHTPFGRSLHAVGSNAQAARLVGLAVDRITMASFALAGALAGLAGVLQVARSGTGNPQTGPGFVLPALAAAFLGATVFRPGRYNTAGTVLAVFFVAVTVSGLTLSGADPWVEQVVNGIALILALALSSLLARRRLGA